MNIIMHNILLYIIYTPLFKCGYCLYVCIMYIMYILNTRWDLKFSIHLKCLQFMNFYTFVQLLLFYYTKVASSQ